MQYTYRSALTREDVSKLIEALESGDFKQCHGRFYTPAARRPNIEEMQEHCCLNVATIIFGLPFGPDAGCGSPELKQRFDFRDGGIHSLYGAMMFWNDKRKMSFAQIAANLRECQYGADGFAFYTADTPQQP